MFSKIITDRINFLKIQINLANDNYYLKNNPNISDLEYDLLIAELVKLEEENPEYFSIDSPTQLVGSDITNSFPQISHKRPMLSLGNTYSREEVLNFDSRVKNILGDENYSYTAELKIDGVAVSIHYEKGKFYQAVTRGNGEEGEEITNNVKTIKSIPLFINNFKVYDYILDDFEIRGEIFIKKNDFYLMNSERELIGEKLFANPRNSASGTLKMLDSTIVASRPLSMFGYYLYSENIELKSHSENLKILKEIGVPINPHSRVCKSIFEVLDYCDEWENKRDELEYEIDGVVIKIDSLKHQDELGFVSKAPRWAIAYKFSSKKTTTKLKGITFQVGRLGTITPVAELEPILLSGSTIRRATLNNSDFIILKDIRIGDTVVIEKGGDVIPKVSEVVISERNVNSIQFSFPTHCPCHFETLLTRPDGEVNFYCENPDCPSQIKGRISHFSSRAALDIEGLGEKVVDQFVELGLLETYADIYDLESKKKQILELERWGIKSIENLLNGINESKNKPFAKVLFALGIRHVGSTVAKILSYEFGSLNSLIEATFDQLVSTNEIGVKIAESVIRFFSNDTNITIINRLKESGLNFENEIKKNIDSINSPFFGKTIVLTGTLMHYSREKASALIEEFGGKTSSSVSKKTDLLIVGLDAGSKLIKANSLGVKIITEDVFKNMIEGLKPN
jgi:DNA ligase (NAD+)